jgi:2-oxo-4-hydroxy-4-carboxy--5-ureidoimidazoline (OHCU) decarboxylase
MLCYGEFVHVCGDIFDHGNHLNFMAWDVMGNQFSSVTALIAVFGEVIKLTHRGITALAGVLNSVVIQ